ncbi:hypothetical protein ACFQ60_00290 [Streptomyces zhihengii]|uniref:Pentapeptide repeat-containing protein n=1 Tax=Streptomyces zhihengii TaxID=1818004 RepID=A0ABS2V5Q4_9ACTN|nr:hypothetical protein [Streptomyces zhihengii]MBM9624826.1 hypothetical protein [Streptomyces zhihengii]
MSSDRSVDRLECLLARAHQQLGIAVQDGLMGSDGPPVLRDPDQVLGRLLAAAHRQTGAVVSERLASWNAQRRAGHDASRNAVPSGGLMCRAAAVRLKYREEALKRARRYMPLNVVHVVRDAADAVQQVIAFLEFDQPVPKEHLARLEQRGYGMRRLVALPQVPQRPSALGGFDYVDEVDAYLTSCTEPLVAQVRRVLHLFDSDVTPYFDEASMSWLGFLEVAQDLADDLDLAHREAVALSRAVTSVEEASSDFRGADLRSVNLTGVALEGIRWNTSTVWPAEWEERIWRASLATASGGGELVVRGEPHDSTVPADI